ncbi:MAG: GtrA family protein [Candidatus Wildermuthbacteria bacterium]|nr:GtrA family protein [Candidatus Wildermuthbacteria bacterium]
MNKKDIIASAAIGFLIAVFSFIILQNPDVKEKLSDLIPYSQAAFIIFPLLSIIGIFVAKQIGKFIPLVFQAAKFALVGVSNTAVDIGILTIFILLTEINQGITYSVFKGISFSAAVVNSYLWNKFWTFKKETEAIRVKHTGAEFVQFLTVSVIGFLLNVGTASLIVNIMKPQFGISPNLWAIVGAIGGTIVVFTWNFLGYKFIVFRHQESTYGQSRPLSQVSPKDIR